MANLKETAKTLIKGYHLEPTKISSELSTNLPDGIKIKNSKGYYYFLLILDLALIWFLIFKQVNNRFQIEELLETSFWYGVGIIVFLGWGLILMTYRLFIDSGEKLSIDKVGIRANNILSKVNIPWSDIETTHLRIGSNPHYELIIKTKIKDHEVYIGNLDKSPYEIGHFIELFKRHYAQQNV